MTAENALGPTVVVRSLQNQATLLKAQVKAICNILFFLEGDRVAGCIHRDRNMKFPAATIRFRFSSAIL